MPYSVRKVMLELPGTHVIKNLKISIFKTKAPTYMTDSIAWETEMERARKRSRVENLPILLFFHNPN